MSDLLDDNGSCGLHLNVVIVMYMTWFGSCEANNYHMSDGKVKSGFVSRRSAKKVKVRLLEVCIYG